ncbi:MAG TPA: DMT family transporter [Oscillospiraceae bacterium]|nr:DMT family transporter [Oscillospiraceae bacterium]
MKQERRMLLLADAALLTVAAIWGLTFVTVKNAINLLPPFAFNFYRFGLAALIMAAFALPYRREVTKATVKAGTVLGIFLFLGYSFQTLGLLYTTASNAGFITGLSVVFVPLFSLLIAKERPASGVIIGALCAATGLAFISGVGVANFNVGDLLVLCGALSFALHIIFVGKYTMIYSIVWLVTLQIGIVALCSGIFSLLLESGNNTFQPAVWPALIITALFATCFAFFAQNYLQQFTSPGHTAIILTSEPVFSAIFSVILLQETISSYAYWGGALIVIGMILSEFKALPWSKTNEDSVPVTGQE